MEGSPPGLEDGVEVRSYFVRNRNALLTRAEVSPLYVDYYLHLADQQVRYAPEADAMLKELLAAMVLHAATRPRNETIALTVHIEEPPVNLFATASSQPGQVTGQLFDEHVKAVGENMIHADVVRDAGAVRRSVVPFHGSSPLGAVEALYRQSEQRPARFFRHDVEDFVMISAQPDCDTEWLESLDDVQIRTLDQTETLALLETRRYVWRCGCNERRMLEVLTPSMRSDPGSLFGDSETIRISCPRCGNRYAISRETMEAFLAASPES